jgi:hypothetical protein
MIVVLMLVAVIASWTMLVGMFLLMMGFMMMSMIVLAPWTMLVMRFFLSLAISFVIVIVSMVRVVLVPTTEIESWLQLTQWE